MSSSVSSSALRLCLQRTPHNLSKLVSKLIYIKKGNGMNSVDLLLWLTFIHTDNGTFNPGAGTHVKKLIIIITKLIQ